jgi:glutaryl-CoA dehydrogenase
MCQELGPCDSGLRAMFSVQNSLVMCPISLYGSDPQEAKWLPAMACGEAIGCFALSEPDFGLSVLFNETKDGIDSLLHLM